MVTDHGLAIPAAVAAELLAHARAELPNEACGLLSGSLADGMMVLDWVLEQGYKNVSILGYSWGAQVAFPAFISLPDEIRGKLVLMSPATFIPENSSLEQLVKEAKVPE